METNRIYYLFAIAIPFITVANKDLHDVYGRILTIVYNGKNGSGIIGLEICESLDPQITYFYEVPFNLPPSGSISAPELVAVVLDSITGSSIVNNP